MPEDSLGGQPRGVVRTVLIFSITAAAVAALWWTLPGSISFFVGPPLVTFVVLNATDAGARRPKTIGAWTGCGVGIALAWASTFLLLSRAGEPLAAHLYTLRDIALLYGILGAALGGVTGHFHLTAD